MKISSYLEMNYSIVIIFLLESVLIYAFPEQQHRQNPPQKQEGWSWKVLNEVVENGGPEESIQQLISQGVSVNIMDELGWTPLHLASFHGHLKIVDLLLRNGANVSIPNDNGQTALHWAASQGHEKIVDLLIKNGADIDLVNNNGWTPLHEAVQWGNEKVVQVLLQNNANRHIKDKNGKKPIDIGKKINGQSKIVDLLSSRTAQKACDLYSELLDKFVESQARSINDRITGGKPAHPGEFQWMASLGYGNLLEGYTFYCGGVIISEYYILTAAHCAAASYKKSELIRPPPSIVRYGKLTRNDNDGIKAKTRDVDEIIRHPGYSVAQNWKNDIALIRVKTPLVFTESIRPICLNTDIRDESSDVKLVVAGWGSISGQEFIRSNELRKTQVITMPLSQCKEAMKQFGISDSHYCAFDPGRRNDSCQGDSGGPLQIPAQGTTEAKLVGIVSFGIKCASGWPGIYSRVAYYLDWIESFVWPHDVITIPKFEIEQTNSTTNSLTNSSMARP